MGTAGPSPKGKATRERFAKALIRQAAKGRKLNATAAAKEAGLAPKSATQTGSRLLSDAYVQDRIRRAMGPDEIMRRLSNIARGRKPSKVVRETGTGSDGNGGTFPVERTRREFDRKGALESMARIRGLVKDGPPPAVQAINVNVVLPQVPEEVLWKLREVLSKAKATDIVARVE